MGSRDDSPGFGITGLRGECVPFIGFLATMAVMTAVAHVLGSERLHGRDGRVEIPIWEMRGIGNTGFGNSGLYAKSGVWRRVGVGCLADGSFSDSY